MNKEYAIYLTIPESDSRTMTPVIDLPDAFTTGYAAAMHKTRTYNRIFAIKEREDRVNHVKGELEKLPSFITTNYRDYLCPDPKTCGKIGPSGMLRQAFIRGYVLGIHQAGKYDNVLHATSEHEVVNTITGDLILLERKWEDSSRAIARIIMKTYGNPDTTSEDPFKI